MADKLSFSTSSPSYTFNNNPSFQLIPCIILHDLSLLCSFIISHPLYSSYFIFFSPYLIRFISFVSPVFIATTFLSILLTTTTAFCPKLPQLELGIIQTVLEELKSNLDDVKADEEERNFEDFEVYKIVFGSTIVDEDNHQLELPVRAMIPENSVHGGRRNDITTTGSATKEVNNLEKLFEELDKFEDCTPAIESSWDELRKEEPDPVKKASSRSEAVVVAVNSSDNSKIIQNSGMVDKSSSWRLNSSISLGSHGSMREKEWRRTLACKLFEERHNSGWEEGMDSLWEAYENDNSDNQKETVMKNNSKNTTMMKNKNNGGIKSFEDDHDHDNDEDDEEEETSNGHLCCLQALKFSTGKMNLGMGKPNIVKISKALKGFGWLHHHSNKHGKKR